MPKKPRVNVIIVTYNGGSFIKKCLHSLMKQTYPSNAYTLTVVDNNSTDGTQNILRSFPTIKILFNKKNLGFGRANNCALKLCISDYAILLNQDSIVEKDFIQQLVTVMESHSSIVACGAAEHPYKKTHKINSTLKEANWIGCGATIFRMTALQKIGFFDDAYFMYNEDIDLSLRLRLAGGKIYYSPDVIWHHHGHGREVDTANEFRVIHSSVSRLYFLLKFGSLRQILWSLYLYLHGFSQKGIKVTPKKQSLPLSQQICVQRKKLLIKILFLSLLKLPIAIVKRYQLRFFTSFNQKLVNALISETDLQIYGN